MVNTIKHCGKSKRKKTELFLATKGSQDLALADEINTVWCMYMWNILQILKTRFSALVSSWVG